MSKAGRILWVTEEAPSRALGGGSIRQGHLFEALAGVYETDLLIAAAAPDPAVARAAGRVLALPARQAPWSEHPLLRRGLELAITVLSAHPSALYPAAVNRMYLGRALSRRAGAYELVCVEHASLAPLGASLGGIPATLTLHHLLSEMTRQQLGHTAGARQRWYRARDLAKAQRLERAALMRFERVFTCSDQDAQLLARLGDGARVRVVPNGVDLTAIRVAPIPPVPRVLFPGSLAYGPNVDGALWFCREVWPLVRAQIGDAELVLAGRAPTPEVVALGTRPGVSVHANVPVMGDYFQAARAVVVPLRIGTGTRLKALEAMASGRPVVGTTVGLEGIGVIDSDHALVRDEPQAMASALVEALSDDALAHRLGSSGRELVAARFGWERIGADYVAMIGELLQARGQASRGPSSAQR